MLYDCFCLALRPLDLDVAVLIMPRLYDSGPAHRQSVWHAQCNTLPVVRVAQQEWAAPRCSDWVARLSLVMQHNARDDRVRDVVLAAHSTACPTIAHWAREAPVALLMRVRGALLVAPSDPLSPHDPAGLTGFAPMPMNALPFPTTVAASHNDECVTYAQAERYAAAWGSRLWDFGQAGHISADAGYGPWPDVWRAVEAMAAAPLCRLAQYTDVSQLTEVIHRSVR